MFLRRRAGYAVATELGRQAVTVDQEILERTRARRYAVVLSDVLDRSSTAVGWWLRIYV
jgi:hypothetical protein